MKDLVFSLDAVEIVGNIYKNSTTSFIGNNFETTHLITVNHCTIQGDTFSPYLFIIFLQPLLRWLENDNLGYYFNTSTFTCTTMTYAYDLAIIPYNIQHMQPQIINLKKFLEWSHIDLTLSKCAITGCPNRSKFKPNTFKAYIQSQKSHTKPKACQTSHKTNHTHT
jgi:hypothetical protein